MMEQSTFADLKRSLVDALVQSGLAGSAGDMAECQAHEVAEVAARIAWPLSREVAHLEKDNAGWRQRVEGLEATLETARNSAVEDIRLLDQLRRDRAAAESSRRDWAAEAERRRLEVEFEVNAVDLHWDALMAAIEEDRDPRQVCACITDEQAAALGPRFSRPVCAVHPEGSEALVDDDGLCDHCSNPRDLDDSDSCSSCLAAVEGGA